MKYKICIRRLSPDKVTRIEEWLSEMLKSGWAVYIIIFNIFVFKKEMSNCNYFFIFTISFGTKIFEVMYSEDLLINGIYEGRKVPSFSFYRCFAVPIKYKKDMKRIFSQRSKILLQFVKEKIIMCCFLTVLLVTMSLASILGENEIKVHYVSIPLTLYFLLLFVDHLIEFIKLNRNAKHEKFQ